MLSSRLNLGSRLTFVGGKGGVGKTTVAAAIALELADSGQPCSIISVDPAHSLADAFDLRLSPDLTPLPEVELLSAAEIDADLEHRRFASRYGELVEELIERGTYLDRSDVEQISASSLPGIDELAALLSLRRLVEERQEPIIVDTAPTGHTLRLLELPQVALSWVGALEAMDAKHIAVASALGGAYREDNASAFLSELRRDLHALVSLLRDAGATRFIIVTTSEAVVLPETYRLQDRLEELRISPGGIVVNRSSQPRGEQSSGVVSIPLLDPPPIGPEGLRQMTAAADGASPGPPPPADTLPASSARIRLRPLQIPKHRRLYLAVGKGGVGKSTSSAAVATQLADAGSTVLLLSIDPAGSLGEVLGQEIGPAATAVVGVPRLFARQLDARQSWGTFVDRYREEVEGVFAGLLSETTSASLDRAVIDRLIDLSPPGIDELMALMEVIDANEDRVYDALVVDTAPTGHLLRLLQLPELALEWTHSLIRLLLKYREVVQLGGTGERVLKLARSLRKVQSLLRDPEQTLFLVVTLPDPLSVAETGRLLGRLRELGTPPPLLVVNRGLDGENQIRRGIEDLHASFQARDQELDIALAPAQSQGPVGPELLRFFINNWRSAVPSSAS